MFVQSKKLSVSLLALLFFQGPNSQPTVDNNIKSRLIGVSAANNASVEGAVNCNLVVGKQGNRNESSTTLVDQNGQFRYSKHTPLFKSYKTWLIILQLIILSNLHVNIIISSYK